MVLGGNAALRRGFPKAVLFFGPDGVGKTTQARLLIRYLRFRKSRPWWVWIRGRHSLAFLLACFFTKLGYYKIVKTSRGTKHKVFDPQLLPKLHLLWGIIEFVSVLPWILLRVYLPIFLGYTIVAERYVVDTVVYLSYWLGYDFLQGFLAKILLNFIPKDSVLIHFDAETQLLLKRIQNDTVTKDFVVFQRRVCYILAKMLNAVTIDTSKSDVKQTFQQILEVLNVN